MCDKKLLQRKVKALAIAGEELKKISDDSGVNYKSLTQFVYQDSAPLGETPLGLLNEYMERPDVKARHLTDAMLELAETCGEAQEYLVGKATLPRKVEEFRQWWRRMGHILGELDKEVKTMQESEGQFHLLERKEDIDP